MPVLSVVFVDFEFFSFSVILLSALDHHFIWIELIQISNWHVWYSCNKIYIVRNVIMDM